MLVQRAKSVEQASLGVLAVPDREDDRVSLVALDTLKVLDEELLVLILVEELLQLGVGSELAS